jgi:restriction endonuclease S subunit
LLEGLEISVLSLSEVQVEETAERADAEFFQKEFVRIQKFIEMKPFNSLRNVTNKINVGFVGSMVEHYTESGKILIQTKNVDEFFLKLDEPTCIDLEFHEKLSKSQIKRDDILIARSGSFGKASIYLSDEILNSSDIIIVEADNKNVLPCYLVTFLNSNYGVSQLVRFASGGLQGHVNLTILENLNVPILSKPFQQQIEDLVKSAHSTQETSKALYQEAENLLLSELGIDESIFKVSKNEVVTNVKSFADFENSWRLDAEYYQPKYDLSDKAVQENAQYIRTISEITVYNARGLQPIYDDFGTLDVINSRHILEQELDYKSFEKTNETAWETQERARVYKDDILTYTTGANIGRTQVYSSSERAFASNHVNILRIKEENPIYVAFVINSKIGRLQTEKLSAGSAQQELYPKDLNMFYIPFVKQETQDQICDNIEASQSLKTKSEQLLSLAKRAVEIAIEEGEDAAMRWIEERK